MKNWKKIGPVTLKDTANDRRFTYDDIYDFCRARNSLIFSEMIGDDTVLDSIWQSDSVGKIPGKYRYLLLDEQGLIIPLWKITECFNHVKAEFETKSWIWRWYRQNLKHCEYRRDPIPETGKHRWRFSNQFRNPKTMAERREADGIGWDKDAKYYGVKCRNKRSHKMLPSSYDDVQRSDLRNCRNWKQNRKKQWT